jgi:hypothetical protein
MTESAVASGVSWWKTPRHWWAAFFAQREGRVLLNLSILIVVAFIHLTGRIGLRLYPAGSAAWRHVLIPVVGSLGMGYLLFRYFPDAREFPHVHADHPLDLALERMGAARLDVLPVVSRANIHQMLGIVVLSDVLNSFGVDPTKWTDTAV